MLSSCSIAASFFKYIKHVRYTRNGKAECFGKGKKYKVKIYRDLEILAAVDTRSVGCLEVSTSDALD